MALTKAITPYNYPITDIKRSKQNVYEGVMNNEDIESNLLGLVDKVGYEVFVLVYIYDMEFLLEVIWNFLNGSLSSVINFMSTSINKRTVIENIIDLIPADIDVEWLGKFLSCYNKQSMMSILLVRDKSRLAEFMINKFITSSSSNTCDIISKILDIVSCDVNFYNKDYVMNVGNIYCNRLIMLYYNGSYMGNVIEQIISVNKKYDIEFNLQQHPQILTTIASTIPFKPRPKPKPRENTTKLLDLFNPFVTTITKVKSYIPFVNEDLWSVYNGCGTDCFSAKDNHYSSELEYLMCYVQLKRLSKNSIPDEINHKVLHNELYIIIRLFYFMFVFVNKNWIMNNTNQPWHHLDYINYYQDSLLYFNSTVAEIVLDQNNFDSFAEVIIDVISDVTQYHQPGQLQNIVKLWNKINFKLVLKNYSTNMDKLKIYFDKNKFDQSCWVMCDMVGVNGALLNKFDKCIALLK